MFPFHKQLFLFTKQDFVYALGICFMFGCTIGLFVLVSRTDDVCQTYFENKGYCYAAIGASAAVINGATWPFLNSRFKTWISLTSTLPLSPIYAVQMTILGYVETLKPLQHIYSLTKVPLEVAECVKEEVVYSVALVRRNLFSVSHVQQMNTAVIQVAETFDAAKRSQDKFREAIETVFKWLEEKGMTCEQTLVRPAKMCRPVREFFSRCYAVPYDKEKLTEEEHYYCFLGTYKTFYYEPDTGYNHTWVVSHDRASQWFYGIYCDGVALLSNAVCGIFSKEAVTEMLLRLRDQISAWISDAIRMRMGIQFQVHTTAYIEDELSNAWAPFKKALQTGSDFIGWLYGFIVLFVSRYIGFLTLLLFPVGYSFYYNRGPPDFDNHYIPSSLQDKEWAKMTEDTPDDLKFLPLQYIETKKLQMVPAWIPTPEEIKTFVQSLIWTSDLMVILVILLIDYYYTYLVDAAYYGSMMLFNRYQGNVFDYVHKPDLKGMAMIGQMVVEQLDKLQQAAGLGRMVACARRAPPITYGYNVFLLTFIMRIAYLYAKVKLSWLPSMMCARYNEHRHNQRMRCLKARTLLVRQSYEPPAMFPWLKSLFQSFNGFSKNGSFQGPSWIRSIMNFRGGLNI